MLIQGLILHVRKVHRANRNDSIAIKNYCQVVGLNMINGLPDVRIIYNNEIYENMRRSIIYNIELRTNSLKRILFNFNVDKENAYKMVVNNGKKKDTKVNISKTRIKHNRLIERFNFTKLDSKCRLWHEYITGERWCYHTEIFGISTNMWRVRGAEHRMIKAIKNNASYANQADRKIDTIKNSSKYLYLPMRCNNFCPYHNSCSNQGLNMLHAVDNKRGTIRRVENTDVISLNEGASSMQKAILEAINDKSKDIYVAVGGTGVGKTNILKSLPDYSGLGISYPNHRLGLDIVERLNIKEAVHMKELQLEDEDVLKEFRRLQPIGAYSHARSYLKDYCNTLLKKANSGLLDKAKVDNIIESINEYFESLEKSATTKNTVFCTHKRMLELNNPNIHTYIIDEIF